MTMTAMDPVDFARMAVGATDDSIIVLQLHNSGGSSRWGQQFPSLSSEQLNMIDDTAFLHFDSWIEAARTFERLTADCAENDTGGLISGAITLVCRPNGEDDGIETHEWDLNDSVRPVFRNRAWTNEQIVERI